MATRLEGAQGLNRPCETAILMNYASAAKFQDEIFRLDNGGRKLCNRDAVIATSLHGGGSHRNIEGTDSLCCALQAVRGRLHARVAGARHFVQRGACIAAEQLQHLDLKILVAHRLTGQMIEIDRLFQ